MEWINVKDRLPEQGDDVLIYGSYYDNGKYAYAVASYVCMCSSTKRPIFIIYCSACKGEYESNMSPTHWMELPQEPPCSL